MEITLAVSFHNVCATTRTGTHTVADVYCLGCNERMGWYYIKAPDNSQKYKEGRPVMVFKTSSSLTNHAGKYLLEREKLVKDNAWKLDDE